MHMNRFVKIALMIGAIVLVAKVLPESQPGEAPATAAKPKCDETMAFVISQKFITDRLKAPATADFPWKSSDGVAVRDLGACAFNVAAYVDAQNSFWGEHPDALLDGNPLSANGRYVERFRYFNGRVIRRL
jgi:hypothetical protein